MTIVSEKKTVFATIRHVRFDSEAELASFYENVESENEAARLTLELTGNADTLVEA